MLKKVKGKSTPKTTKKVQANKRFSKRLESKASTSNKPDSPSEPSKWDNYGKDWLEGQNSGMGALDLRHISKDDKNAKLSVYDIMCLGVEDFDESQTNYNLAVKDFNRIYGVLDEQTLAKQVDNVQF